MAEGREGGAAEGYPEHVALSLSVMDEEKVNIDAIHALVAHIDATRGPGAVLVFIPLPPFTSRYLPTPPYTSLHLPTPPYTSLYLPISPYISQVLVFMPHHHAPELGLGLPAHHSCQVLVFMPGMYEISALHASLSSERALQARLLPLNPKPNPKPKPKPKPKPNPNPKPKRALQARLLPLPLHSSLAPQEQLR